jgi:hypothetical protein
MKVTFSTSSHNLIIIIDQFILSLLRCSWELFWGTCHELGNSFGEPVRNLGTLWGNMSGTWELFGGNMLELGNSLLWKEKSVDFSQCVHTWGPIA